MALVTIKLDASFMGVDTLVFDVPDHMLNVKAGDPVSVSGPLTITGPNGTVSLGEGAQVSGTVESVA